MKYSLQGARLETLVYQKEGTRCQETLPTNWEAEQG